MRAIIFDYFGVLAHNFGRCDEEVMQFVQKQLAGKVKLAILSNMPIGTASEMLGDFVGLFSVVVLSGELGYRKPDRRAFLETARRLGEFPSDCLLIDDSLRNCRGAEDAGMEAIHYTGLADLGNDLQKYAILTS